MTMAIPQGRADQTDAWAVSIHPICGTRRVRRMITFSLAAWTPVHRAVLGSGWMSRAFSSAPAIPRGRHHEG